MKPAPIVAVAFALERPIEIGGRARAGWWRIVPGTGETIAMLGFAAFGD
jgi:hypothetical protein